MCLIYHFPSYLPNQQGLRRTFASLGTNDGKNLNIYLQEEKDVIVALRALTKEKREAVQYFDVWGKLEATDIKDICEKVVAINSVLFEAEADMIKTYIACREKFKTVRERELKVHALRHKARKARDVLERAARRNRSSEQLEFERNYAEEELREAEADHVGRLRADLRDALNIFYGGYKDLAVKMTAAAKFGRHLSDQIPQGTLKPGQELPPFTGGSVIDQIYNDFKLALDGRIPLSPSPTPPSPLSGPRGRSPSPRLSSLLPSQPPALHSTPSYSSSLREEFHAQDEAAARLARHTPPPNSPLSPLPPSGRSRTPSPGAPASPLVPYSPAAAATVTYLTPDFQAHYPAAPVSPGGGGRGAASPSYGLGIPSLLLDGGVGTPALPDSILPVPSAIGAAPNVITAPAPPPPLPAGPVLYYPVPGEPPVLLQPPPLVPGGGSGGVAMQRLPSPGYPSLQRTASNGAAASPPLAAPVPIPSSPTVGWYNPSKPISASTPSTTPPLQPTSPPPLFAPAAASAADPATAAFHTGGGYYFPLQPQPAQLSPTFVPAAAAHQAPHLPSPSAVVVPAAFAASELTSDPQRGRTRPAAYATNGLHDAAAVPDLAPPPAPTPRDRSRRRVRAPSPLPPVPTTAAGAPPPSSPTTGHLAPRSPAPPTSPMQLSPQQQQPSLSRRNSSLVWNPAEWGKRR
ncbi:hypothetical protein HK405_013054 [Cladochytrium tenue]|nr:hypothetical protein HK405_013054 [Cladochytrium tenue]